VTCPRAVDEAASCDASATCWPSRLVTSSLIRSRRQAVGWPRLLVNQGAKHSQAAEFMLRVAGGLSRSSGLAQSLQPPSGGPDCLPIRVQCTRRLLNSCCELRAVWAAHWGWHNHCSLRRVALIACQSGCNAPADCRIHVASCDALEMLSWLPNERPLALWPIVARSQRRIFATTKSLNLPAAFKFPLRQWCRSVLLL
jgi:hypothetical protein